MKSHITKAMRLLYSARAILLPAADDGDREAKHMLMMVRGVLEDMEMAACSVDGRPDEGDISDRAAICRLVWKLVDDRRKHGDYYVATWLQDLAVEINEGGGLFDAGMKK
jgi:hypothetical protein